MGSCYSSQGKNHIEEALEPSNGSITTTTTTTSTISPSLSSRLVSGRWKNKSKRKKKRRKSGDAYRKTGSVDFSFLGKIGSGGGTATEELHGIPGTMFINGASDAACLYTQQGRKGPNQDAMLVWENFSSRSDIIFCGVFDGHGPYGHMVAKKVRDSLALKLCTQLKANFGSDQNDLYQNTSAPGSRDSEETTSIGIDDEWCEPLEVDENEKYPEIYVPLKHSLLKAFKLMDKELKLHPTIDCFCSGTTAVTLIKQGQDLIIGNVGDSRAVLGTRDKDHSLVAIQLTVDLKPNLPREAARIHQCKGRVFALQDEPEVARVWLPNSDSPGLAMARAFGDFCLKDFGLISVPDVSYHCLSERDEFVVLATDGVWDVLSNKEVVDIIASAPNRATAARSLVDCAVRAWRLKFPTSKSDDCAAVCLFLDHLSTHGPSGTEENALVKETGEVEPIVTNMIGGEKQCTNMHGLEVDAALIEGPVLDHLVNLKGSDEIVPITESIDRKLPERCQSTRSLAECISTAEDEEWSALEGITRVNSLLNLPRFLSNDKRATNRRKWF